MRRGRGIFLYTVRAFWFLSIFLVSVSSSLGLGHFVVWAGEPVLLTVVGKDGNRHPLKRSDLNALPQYSITTSTPWTKGDHAYEGPRVVDLLDRLGLQGQRLTNKALDGYKAHLTVQDARTYGAILATRQDGRPMSVRNRGPIWLMLPFDQRPEIYNEPYFFKAVWQLREMTLQ